MRICLQTPCAAEQRHSLLIFRRLYAFAQRSALLDWLQSPDSWPTKFQCTCYLHSDYSIFTRASRLPALPMEEDTLALAIVTIPAAVPPNVTVSLVLAGHGAACSSGHKNPFRCHRAQHPEATLLQTDHVPAWCWHSATEVLLELVCYGVCCVGPDSCVEETKMVTPSDPNGQQFTLPGQAGRVIF